MTTAIDSRSPFEGRFLGSGEAITGSRRTSGPSPSLTSPDDRREAMAARRHAVARPKDGRATTDQERLVRAARYHYSMRRRRDAMIGRVFGEPGWDMLLALFIARSEGRVTPVKNICLASETSTSTAMRRLERLLASGLICRTDDLVDARRSLIELTRQGYDLMASLLDPEM